MSKPIARLKIGNVECTAWQSDKYPDSKQYTFQRSSFDKNTKQWSNTNYFNQTDLLNLAALAQKVISEKIKITGAQAKAPAPKSAPQEKAEEDWAEVEKALDPGSSVPF